MDYGKKSAGNALQGRFGRLVNALGRLVAGVLVSALIRALEWGPKELFPAIGALQIRVERVL